ncbi:MAG: DctP family TRAP transporter solute-binding subunit [Thermodesulfobacteriota bacterium]
MIHKRSLFFILFFALFAFLGGAISAQAQTIVIKIAHADPADPCKVQKHAQALAIKSMVESETGGRVKVEVYAAGALGGEREYLEGVNIGTIQIGIASGPMAGFFKEAMIFDVPYLFPSADIVWKVLDGPFGEKLSKLLSTKTNMINLAYGETGFRNFTNSLRLIRTPADVKGMKVRVMENPIYMELVKSLGGSPTPIAWTETYTALKQKVVDGQENPVSTIVYAKLYEVQKYLTLDGHSYGVDWTVINKKFFEGLPADIKMIVKRAGVISGTINRGVKQLNEKLGTEELAKHMEIYAPTPEEKELFRKQAQPPVIKWLKTQIDPGLVDEALRAVDMAIKAKGY